MARTDCIPGKGMRTKLLSVLVVSLFFASAFCAMIAIPTESETVIQNVSAEDFDEIEESFTTDNPLPPVNCAADFTVDAAKALETLNSRLRTTTECEWDANTKTLNIAPIELNVNYMEEANDLGAAIVLPAGSTVNVIGPSKIVIDVMESQTLSHAYGIYCYGDLNFNTNWSTIEFVLANLEKRKICDNDVLSAGLYVQGKLTVTGEKMGRLAVRSGFNNVTPTIAICAKGGLVVENSEIMASANIGKCLKDVEFANYCTIGIYAPNITVDIKDCQKLWVRGGLNDKYNVDSKSCGIVTNNLEVKHGNVIAKGGNHFELSYSIGIHFIGEKPSLTGKGSVSANGGNSGRESIGIFGDELYINIAKLNASGSYSGDFIHGIRVDSVEMRDTDLNITIGNVNEVDVIRGMICKKMVCVNSNIVMSIDGCNHVWGTLIDEASYTGCKIDIEIKNCPYNYVVDANGMVGHQLEFKDCEVNVKIGDSRFNEQGLNVPDGPEGKGWLIIDHSKVNVEMGNDVGVDNVFITGVVAYNMKVTHSELYVMSGNSDSATCGIRMNGGVAVIENSKVIACGGDLIGDGDTNPEARTTGFTASNNVTITDSEVCFWGGEVNIPDGKSIGLNLISKEREQELKITNSKFDANGGTNSIVIEDKDLCKITCPELYGMNKETGNYEKFNIGDIDKYTDAATSNWIEEQEKGFTIPASVVIVGVQIALMVIVGVLMYRRSTE